MAHPDESQDLRNPNLEPVVEGVTQTPSGAASAPVRGPLRTALLLFAAAIALCLLGYLMLSVPASWFPAATPKALFARDLAITRGEGNRVVDDLVVTATDATGTAVVSANTDFHSADYPVVAWVAIDLADNADVRLLWRSDYASAKLNTVQLTVVSGRLLPVALARNPAWVGRIKGLALLIRGPLQQPVRIQGVLIKPMGALELMKDRAREWVAFEGWSGTSINAVAGGADLQDLPLPTLLAVAFVLAIAAWYGYGRWRGSVTALPIVIAALFVLDVQSRTAGGQDGCAIRRQGLARTGACCGGRPAVRIHRKGTRENARHARAGVHGGRRALFPRPWRLSSVSAQRLLRPLAEHDATVIDDAAG